MKKRTWMVIVFASAAMILGCSDDHAMKKTEGGKKLSGIAAAANEKWMALSQDAVVIRIGSNVWTRAHCENYAKMMCESAAIRDPGVPREKLDAVLVKNWPRIKDEIVSRMLLDVGIEITNKVDREPYRQTLKQRFAQRLSSKKQKVTFEKIQQEMEKKGLLEAFMRNFEQDLKVQIAFSTTYSNDLTVTDAEYQRVRNNVESWNRRSAATNRINQATANHVRRMLDEGGDFAKLADEYSQDAEKNPGGDLGECDVNSMVFVGMDADTFEQGSYWRTVSTLKDGEVSPVMETDTGWEIVKMIKHVSTTNSNIGVAAYHLARIYFRRAYMYPEQDEEEFRDDLRVEKREALLQRISRSVQKKTKVEFPQGEDVFKLRRAPGSKKVQNAGPIPGMPGYRKAGKPMQTMPHGLKD